MKTLVIIPTYNERERIGELIAAIRTHVPEADVLVVDDGSPDGTGPFVRAMGETDSQVSVLQRSGKLGLGTAYIEAFRYALRTGYDRVVGMDADFSHDPACLPQLIAASADHDLVIGSRYVPGGSTPDWKLHRRLISRFGNWFARTLLQLPIRDCTTGYRCYSRKALEALDLGAIDVVGYSFLIETTRQCFAAGLRIREVPITFVDRREGKSKMSGTIAVEAFRYILRHRPPADAEAAAAPHRASPTNVLLAIVALLIYATLIAVRIPDIFGKGRFWAEEMVVYFRVARLEHWYDALFWPHSGYLNFTASAATLAALAVPLEQAPRVSSAIALLIQLLPPILLMTGRIPFLNKPWKMAAALVLLLTVQNSGEVWLNAITSQYHLGICVALILAIPTGHGPARVLRSIILVLAPLTGPAASFLTPLFFLRAIFDRSWARFLQTVLIAVPTLVQLGTLLRHPEPGREYGIGLQMLTLAVNAKHILMPVLGPDRADAVSGSIMSAAQAGHAPWLPLVAPFILAAAFAWGAWASRDAALRWLLAAAALIMTASYFGALAPHSELMRASAGGRYAFIPSSLFALAALGLALTPTRILRIPFALICLWIAVAGIVNFPKVSVMFTTGPVWTEEVAKLRADPTYQPQCWPNGWKWWIGPADR